MRFIGCALLVIIYGAIEMFIGVLREDMDFKQVIFGAQIMATGLIAMMLFGAFVLIFGGEV